MNAYYFSLLSTTCAAIVACKKCKEDIHLAFGSPASFECPIPAYKYYDKGIEQALDGLYGMLDKIIEAEKANE